MALSLPPPGLCLAPMARCADKATAHILSIVGSDFTEKECEQPFAIEYLYVLSSILSSPAGYAMNLSAKTISGMSTEVYMMLV